MKLVRTSTFKQTVKVTMPTEKLDVFRDESFVAEFAMLSNEETNGMSTQGSSVKEQLDRVLKGVSGVGNDLGEPYPADEAIALIKDNPITSLACLHAFNKAMTKDILGKTAKTSSAK